MALDMEWSLSRTLPAFRSVAEVATRSASYQMTDQMLLEAIPEGLRLTGNALDRGAQVVLSENVTIHDVGKSTVSSKRLLQLLQKLPEETFIRWRVENGLNYLHAGTNTYRLYSSQAEEYPVPRALEERIASSDVEEQKNRTWTLPFGVFRNLVDRVIHAVDVESLKYGLQGVHLEVHEGKITAVGTDGIRLATNAATSETLHGVSWAGTLPLGNLQTFWRVFRDDDGNAPLTFSENGFLHVQNVTGNLSYWMRLLEDSYPVWQDIVEMYLYPLESAMRFPRAAFVQSLQRMRVVRSDSKNLPVLLDIQASECRLRAKTADYGSVTDAFEIETPASFTPVRIIVNSAFLLDALSALSEDVVLVLVRGPKMPILLRSVAPEDAFLSLIMPLETEQDWE